MREPDQKIELHMAVDDFVNLYARSILAAELHYEIHNPKDRSWIYQQFINYIESQKD